jgi:thiol-disulfide isomerase/thioredoxin
MSRRNVNLLLVLAGVAALAAIYCCACRKGRGLGFGREGFSGGLLLTFWKMDTCGHCTKFQPVYDDLKKEWEPKGVRFVMNNDLEAAAAQGINSFPTLQFTAADGTVVEHSGERTQEALSAKIRELM